MEKTSCDWECRIKEAIRMEDPSALEEMLALQMGNEMAHQVVADNVARDKASHNGVDLCVELFAIPVISSADGGILNVAWGESTRTLESAVAAWFNSQAQIQILDRVCPYEWIAAYETTDIRELLELPHQQGSASHIFKALEEIALPSKAPRPGLILMTVTTPHTWAKLPNESVEDLRFGSVLSHALFMASEASGLQPKNLPAVMPPDRFQFGLTDSLCLWIKLLHQSVGIISWNVDNADSRKSDAVFVSIRLNDQWVQESKFRLSLNQIGIHGFHEVVNSLEMVAPCLSNQISG